MLTYDVGDAFRGEEIRLLMEAGDIDKDGFWTEKSGVKMPHCGFELPPRFTVIKLISFRDGDIITMLGKQYTLRLGDTSEVRLGGKGNSGAAVKDSEIHVSLDRGNPQETFIHEILEQVLFRLGDLIHV